MARVRLAEKPQNIKKTITSLFYYYKKYIPKLIVALVCSIISAGLSLISPSKIANLVDMISVGLTGEMDVAAIQHLCMFLLFLLLLGFIFGYIQRFLLVGISQRFSNELRSSIFKKVNRIQLKYFDNNNFGDLLSRLVNDVENISDNLSNTIAHLVSSIILLISSAIIMVCINWQMGISAIAFSLFGFAVMTWIVSKSQKYFQANRKNEGELNGYIEEIYAGHKIIKSYNNEESTRNKFNEINNKVYESSCKSHTLSALMQPIIAVIGNISYVIICIMGAYMVSRNVITFGVIVSFIVFIKLFNQPLSSISQMITTLQTTLASAERVFEFMENEELSNETDKVISLTDVHGDVEFSHVKFGYNEETPIIHDFNAKIKAGQKVAIVGPTGAGKTTLVNLLMRFYEMNDGDILIDNVSIKNITRENLHDLFAMVLQDTWIFEGTLRENLVFTTPNITDEQIDLVCNKLGLTSWINTLPDKYDTILSERTSFSGGQQQLITIARAMLKNAPLLILDEATSSIDTKTEKIIQRAMDTLSENRTSFVIAHRLSTIKNADVILVIKDGDIAEMGTHAELLAKNEIYANMYNSQFG